MVVKSSQRIAQMTPSFNIEDLREILWDTHKSDTYYHIPKDILEIVAKCYDEMRFVTVYIRKSGVTTQNKYSKDTCLSEICDQFDAHDALINDCLWSCAIKYTLEMIDIKSGDTIHMMDLGD